MKEVLTKWYRRYLSEEEAVVLLVLLISAFGVTLAFGDILAPVFVAVILAYLMQGVANFMRHRGFRRRSVWRFRRYFFSAVLLLCCLGWRRWYGGSWWHWCARHQP